METNLKNFSGNDQEWDKFILNFPNYCVHHCSSWAKYQEKRGRKILRLVTEEGQSCALIYQHPRTFGPRTYWMGAGVAGDIEKVTPLTLKKSLGKKPFYIRAFFPQERQSFSLQNGWTKCKKNINSKMSFKLELSEDLENIKSKLSKNWRHNLKRSLKHDLSCRPWKDVDTEQLHKYYLQLSSLKNIEEQFSILQLQNIFETCRDKIRLFRAFDQDDNVVALRGYFYHGHKARDQFAITLPEGRKNYSSYFLFWEMIKDMKNQGLTDFDLGGADELSNPGVFNFKKGTGAIPIQYLGEWHYSNIPGLKTLAEMVIKN